MQRVLYESKTGFKKNGVVVINNWLGFAAGLLSHQVTWMVQFQLFCSVSANAWYDTNPLMCLYVIDMGVFIMPLLDE